MMMSAFERRPTSGVIPNAGATDRCFSGRGRLGALDLFSLKKVAVESSDEDEGDFCLQQARIRETCHFRACHAAFIYLESVCFSSCSVCQQVNLLQLGLHYCQYLLTAWSSGDRAALESGLLKLEQSFAADDRLRCVPHCSLLGSLPFLFR